LIFVLNRESFSNNVIIFCRQYGFDGVDLDWEFPSADHRERFGLLTKVFSKFSRQKKISKFIFILDNA